MNIKELADIGAEAVVQDCDHQRRSHICCNRAFGFEYEESAKNREAFAQAVIDACRKSVDERAPVKYNWDALRDAYESGHGLEWRRPADGIHNWQAITWSGPPQFNKDNEYRIAPKAEETDDMLKKRVHELMAENTKLRQQLERNKERQEFEAWYTTDLCEPLEDLGASLEKNIAWDAWKAARNQSK